MVYSAEIRNDSSRPELYVNGERVLPLLFALSDFPAAASGTAYAQKNIASFAAQGINLVAIDTDLRLGWFKNEPFNIVPIKAEVANVLDANPNAAIFIRLHMNPPYWWMRDNPDELVVYGNAEAVDGGDYLRTIKDDGKPMLRVSFASEKWLGEAGEKLALLCRELAATEEGGHVIGIQIACGLYGEWHHWASGNHPDFGECMQRRFRAFLREKYGSDEALREAWGEPNVTIDSSTLAPWTERNVCDDGCMRDPKKRRVLDSLKCHQLSVPEAILRFAEKVKGNWGRPVLTGSFYGYFFGTSTYVSGHLEPEKLYLRPDAIDFLCGPHPYSINRQFTSAMITRGLMESNRLRGMLWLTEMDQHPIGALEGFVGGDPAHLDENKAMLRRNVLPHFAWGEGCWFYDHRVVNPQTRDALDSLFRKQGWWDSPELLSEIKSIRAIADKYTKAPYKPLADVLAVYNTESYYHTPRPVMKSAEIEFGLHDALGFSGAFYDCIYMTELPLAELERYKCIIFVDSDYMSPVQREEAKKACAGRSVIWLHSSGYSDGETLSEDNIRSLTGFKVRRVKQEKSYRTVAPLLPDTRVVTEVSFDPMFAPCGDDIEVAAVFEGSGECAVARKRSDGHSSWFVSLPKFTPNLMRSILNEAGCHIYSDATKDFMTGGSGFIMICSVEGGERTVTLPSGGRVKLTLAPNSTTVIDAGTGEIQ